MEKDKKTKTKNVIPKKVITPVYNQILIQPIHRGINDIGTWKSAIRAADMGIRDRLYDLYTDILNDGTVTDSINKRIEAITDCDINFTVNKKEVPVINDLMDTIEWEEQLKEIMWSLFWGISVDEYSFINGFDFNSIPRKHIRAKEKIILKQQGDTIGISYEDYPMIIQWGKDDDLGLLLKIAPYVIYKRGGFGDWAQFVELFGMPQRIGKYNSTDEQSKRMLIQAFETAGSAPYLVIPKESDVETVTSSGNMNGALYNDFRNACNEEILITVLGQTMTTKDGASLSQSKVHMEVQEKKHRSDRRYVIRMLNKYLLPLLESRGYPVSGGKFSFVDKKDEITVDELKTLSLMIPIPRHYGYEKYGIPEPKEGEEVFLSSQTTPEQKPVEKPVSNKKEPEDKEPDNIENADKGFWTRFMDFFVKAPGSSGAGKVRMSDTASMDDQIIAAVWNGEIETLSPELFYYFSNDFLNGIQSVFKQNINNTDIGVSYDAPDDVFRTAMEQNLYHFSAAKSIAEIQELNNLMRESKTFEEFHRKALQVTDVFNKTWQKTEYNTAVLTAEATQTYRRLKSKRNIFPFWEYKTVGDEKVRFWHRKLDGVILPENDPRWKLIFPPNGWLCRCWVIGRMKHQVNFDVVEMRKRVDEYLQTTEWKQIEAQGWGVNRCDSAQVFTADQMYINKFPDQAAKTLSDMAAKRWGLETVPKNMKAKEEVIPITQDNEKKIWDELQVDGTILLPDYLNRTVTLDKKQFESHTTRKKDDNRIIYWHAMLETLQDPDEVWLNDEIKKDELDTYCLLRYYNDGAMVVNYRIENNKLSLKTWYRMVTSLPNSTKGKLQKIWDKRRHGLLLKKR